VPLDRQQVRSAGGLPLGRYACHYISQYAGPIPTPRSVTILEGGRYQADSGAGQYELDGTTARWTSGPFAAAAARAQVYRDDSGKLAIRYDVEGQTHYCLSD
jgi:hypothetical protein